MELNLVEFASNSKLDGCFVSGADDEEDYLNVRFYNILLDLHKRFQKEYGKVNVMSTPYHASGKVQILFGKMDVDSMAKTMEIASMYHGSFLSPEYAAYWVFSRMYNCPAYAYDPKEFIAFDPQFMKMAYTFPDFEGIRERINVTLNLVPFSDADYIMNGLLEVSDEELSHIEMYTTGHYTVSIGPSKLIGGREFTLILTKFLSHNRLLLVSSEIVKSLLVRSFFSPTYILQEFTDELNASIHASRISEKYIAVKNDQTISEKQILLPRIIGSVAPCFEFRIKDHSGDYLLPTRIPNDFVVCHVCNRLHSRGLILSKEQYLTRVGVIAYGACAIHAPSFIHAMAQG